MIIYLSDLLSVFVAMRQPLAVVLIILVVAIVADAFYRKESK